MKKIVFVIIVALGSTGIISCAKKSSSNTSSFSYDFTYNECPTGKKVFSTQAALCEGLLNDKTNNYCARGMRLDRYEEQCGPLP